MTNPEKTYAYVL